MTEKQKKFCDYYLETGNATQAAIRAGYSKKYANTNASKLLQNTTVQAYIQERRIKLEQSRLMTVQEALERSASIAKGEPQTFIYEELDPDTDEPIKREKKRYTARIEEQQRSIEHILKVGGAFEKKTDEIKQDNELSRIADSLGGI